MSARVSMRKVRGALIGLVEGGAFAYGLIGLFGGLASAGVAYIAGVGAWASSAVGGAGCGVVVAGALLIRIQRRSGIALKHAEENGRRIAEAQALGLFYSEVKTPLPIAPLGAWTLDAWALLFLVKEIRGRDRPLVVELGTGASTPVLAFAACEAGGHLCAIEHEQGWADVVREQVSLWDLDASARVHWIPLRAQSVAGTRSGQCVWYAEDEIHNAIPGGGIDVLVVDGPPGGSVDSRARAYPSLRDRLAPGATIVVDDYERAEEAAMVERWRIDEPRMQLRVLRGRKQTAILVLPGDSCV